MQRLPKFIVGSWVFQNLKPAVSCTQVGPKKCLIDVSVPQCTLNWLDDSQIEELVNFDAFEDQELFEVLDDDEKVFQQVSQLQLRLLILTTHKQMTETVNVLPHMVELRETWRRQNFIFTKEQQEEYDILLAARRERVKYFYDNDLVSKGGLRKREEEPED